jgi:hypothetical protein
LEQRGQPHTRRGRGDRVAARPSRETGGGIRKGGGARSRNQSRQNGRTLRSRRGSAARRLMIGAADLRAARSPRGLRASIPGSSRSAVRFAVRIVSAPHRQIARAPREPNRRPRISQFSSVRPILHQRQHPPNVQSHEKAISDAARRQPQIPNANANAARLRARSTATTQRQLRVLQLRRGRWCRSPQTHYSSWRSPRRGFARESPRHLHQGDPTAYLCTLLGPQGPAGLMQESTIPNRGIQSAQRR